VQLGKSFHRAVDIMTASLGRQTPCWGHHSKALGSRRVDSLGENLVLLDVRRWHLGVVTFLEVSHLRSQHLCGRRGHLEVLRGARLVCVAVKVRRVHGCLRSQAVVQVAVVNSVTVRRRRCSRCGLRYVCP
jgi:hypothetical protein